MEYAHWWGPHWHWSWIVLVLFMILVFVCVGRMVRCSVGWRRVRAHRTGWMPFGWCKSGRDLMSRRWVETPRDILDRRYANGEIAKERYEQMKCDIESSSCGDTLDQQGA